MRLVLIDRGRRERVGTFYKLSATCQIPQVGFLYELIFGRIDDGFFVEVGAYDGEAFSNTSGLADLGWRGVYVEPIPKFAHWCRDRHKANRGITVVEAACGSKDDELIEIALGGPLSTADRSRAHEYENIDWAAGNLRDDQLLSVRSLTLDTLLVDQNAPIGFELLVVDVEGFEEAVFGGFDIDRWRPKMMIVELSDMHPDFDANRDGDLALGRRIVDSGYDVLFKDAVNTVFVRRDVRSLS